MSLSLHFEIQGAPVPKGRPRVVRAGQGVRTYTPAATAAFEKSAAWQIKAQLPSTGGLTLPLDGRIAVGMTFRLTRPKTVTRTHPTVKPDVDNLAKAVLDALEAAGVIVNDSRVTDLYLAKRYADGDQDEGVTVTVTARAQEAA